MKFLTSINVNQVTTLSKACLDNNQKLTQFTIPQSLTSIPDGAIVDCPIGKYVVETGHTVFSSDDDGVVFNTDKTKLLLYPTGRTASTYTIPSTVTEIGGSAFFGATYLTSMAIPSTVTTMDESAFAYCSNLATVEFTETASIDELPSNCFKEDSKLTTITLPSSCKVLDKDAFLNCTGLTTVNVPNGSKLATLSAQCFNGCNLSSFNFQGSCKLTTIGDEVFRGMTNLKSFALPASVTTLGQNAFRGCTNMTTFTFASDAAITEIGGGALADCGITDITLPSSLQKINRESFASCQGLKKATLPTNLDWISPEAFNGCYKLTDIEIGSQNKNYSTAQGVLYDKEKNVLVLYPSGSTANPVFIAPSVTKIGDYAFYDCPYITHIVIPKKVKAFGERAFGLDKKLTRLTLLCDSIVRPSRIDQTTNGMSFDDGTQTGGSNMFANITLCVRKALKAQYADSAFYKKFKAIETTFTAKHDRDSYEDGDEYMALSDSTAALVSTKADVYTYVVSKTVTSADDKKTRTVTQIGDYAFENNYQIKEVVLPDNVSYIGAMAFVSGTWEDSYSDGTVYVRPDSGSPSIESVFFCGSTMPTNMASNYYDLSSYFDEFVKQHIYVKKSLESDFKTAFAGKTYVDSVSYKIPGADIKAKYVSFAREFDVDLSDFESTHPVYAFVAEEKKMNDGPGDYGDGTTKFIRMQSIVVKATDASGNTVTYDGTYIPAGTGVLLKVWNDNETATPADFYYRIGEHSVTTTQNNEMQATTVNPLRVKGSEYDYYIMSKSKGYFQKVNSTKDNFLIAIHKAYIKFNANSSAKLVFLFDDNTPTDISNPHSNTYINNVYYDLNGCRVSHPTKGIYILNGKKVVIK